MPDIIWYVQEVVIRLTPIKKDESQSDIVASYARVSDRTALLNCFPDNICSTVHDAYTPDSTRRSDRPPSPHNLPIHAIKHDKVWNPPNRRIWVSNGPLLVEIHSRSDVNT